MIFTDYNLNVIDVCAHLDLEDRGQQLQLNTNILNFLFHKKKDKKWFITLY